MRIDRLLLGEALRVIAIRLAATFTRLATLYLASFRMEMRSQDGCRRDRERILCIAYTWVVVDRFWKNHGSYSETYTQ